MTARRKWLVAALAIISAPLTLGGAEKKQPMVGEPAPAFRLQTLEGKTLALADLRGKFVVLHFGAGW